MDMAIVITTYGSMESAREVSKRLVQRGVAACASIVRCDSIYEWEGSMQDESECMVLYKTTELGAATLMDEIAGSHPYDTPEIVKVPVENVHPPYLKWLAGQVR